MQNDLHAVADSLAAYRQRRLLHREDVLRKIGDVFWHMQSQDYLAKAFGGTDRAGIKWEPLPEGYVERKLRHGFDSVIGIRTGKQFDATLVDGDAQIFDVRGDDLILGYGTPYSWFFDAERTLIADPLPEAYTSEFDKIAQASEDGLLDEFVGVYA